MSVEEAMRGDCKSLFRHQNDAEPILDWTVLGKSSDALHKLPAVCETDVFFKDGRENCMTVLKWG